MLDPRDSNPFQDLFMDSVSIVVPVYNSEGSLSLLVERLQPVVAAHTSASEIILVNDDSRDHSWDVIKRLADDHPNVRGINLMRNYGQHSALLCGIRAAQYDIIVTLDDDLQNPPEEIPRLLTKLDEGYDVVYGTPQHEQHGLWRDLASQVTKLALQSTMGAKTARNVSAFRAFRTPVREAFAQFQGPYVSIDVLLTWGTSRFAAIPVQHDPRQIGRSNYTLRKLIIHTVNMATGFSTLPLQLASLIGFALTLFGIGVLIYVLGVRYLILGGALPGFPFLASIISIFSGAQLFALGIIGEYLARMHFRLMDRPSYNIRAKTGWEK
jgi:undecaprenyl-phosphate 4-deoxy-4-formamido-L-arabinose transferase